jgi:hypothetical protein
MARKCGLGQGPAWIFRRAAVWGLGMMAAGAPGLLTAQAPGPAGANQQTQPTETAPAAAPQLPNPGASQAKKRPDTHITPQQAQQLFALVDELLQFSSQESGLPIKSAVKRRMTTRAEVEKYLDDKFNEDEGAKRLERDEIVLKKFGLLDRDFDLRPFLVALLKEQIEAYYDSKTKTVNLLDWVDADEQKPVLAHELTHALQDQHSDLDKWDDQTPDDVSTTAAGDTEHLTKDEMDTARDSVAEGQATAVMMDYVLKPYGKSLVKDPEVVEMLKDQMTGTDSPVMSRAPLLLSESMLFPYKEGLSFEQDVWMDNGRTAAFAGALDRPPSSTWEIINPRMYEKKEIPAVPLLPNIHPLVDAAYRPYDIGQVGQLDLHILAELFGGDQAARDLTPAWDGGLYWCGQLRSASTEAEQDTTKSLALFYLSEWKDPDSAGVFAKLYAENLSRKYARVHKDLAATASAPADGGIEQVYDTDEGPVVITLEGNKVFVAESFPLPLARKLTTLILSAQGSGDVRTAANGPAPWLFARPKGEALRPAGQPVDGPALSADLVHFFENCGVMKAAADAAMRLTR